MNVMDKFIQSMHLNNETNDEYDEYDEYDDDEIIDQSSKKVAVNVASDFDNEKSRTKVVTKVSPMRQTRKIATDGMEVCVIKPTTIEDAKEIIETLLANRTVVLNLEGLDIDIAQRIIDYSSGASYAINGNLQKISHYIFIITPASVDISGDFQEILSGTIDVSGINNGL